MHYNVVKDSEFKNYIIKINNFEEQKKYQIYSRPISPKEAYFLSEAQLNEKIHNELSKIILSEKELLEVNNVTHFTSVCVPSSTTYKDQTIIKDLNNETFIINFELVESPSQNLPIFEEFEPELKYIKDHLKADYYVKEYDSIYQYHIESTPGFDKTNIKEILQNSSRYDHDESNSQILENNCFQNHQEFGFDIS